MQLAAAAGNVAPRPRASRAAAKTDFLVMVMRSSWKTGLAIVSHFQAERFLNGDLPAPRNPVQQKRYSDRPCPFRTCPMASSSQDRRKRLAKRMGSVALISQLGPGIITGAADDDPSGIATYSLAGAQAG